MPAETAMRVEFVTITQLGEKGQVTVPKRCRDALRLAACRRSHRLHLESTTYRHAVSRNLLILR